MRLRRDPLAAAAEIALEAERLARADGEAVATVGELAVSPGAANVIPGRVTMSVDARHPDDARKARLVAGVRAVVAEVSQRRGDRGRRSTSSTTSARSSATPAWPAGWPPPHGRSASIRRRCRAAPATTRP